MALTNFKITLNNPSRVYCPGATVSGSVSFTLDAPKEVKGITIKFRGVAKTSFSGSTTRRNREGHSRSECATFSGEDKFFSDDLKLLKNSTLSAGYNEHQFCVFLPATLPDSFSSEHGNIEYFVKAIVDCSGWWWTDDHVQKEFTVVNVVDLNTNSKAKEPVRLELDKYFGCLWCKSGPLTLVIKLPHLGYVPGQNIPLTLEVDNASDVRVNKVALLFRKVLEYKATCPESKLKKVEVDLDKFSLDPVDQHRSTCFTHQLNVPGLPPSKLEQCSIIKCSYFLKVTAEVSGFHMNLSGEVPIIIGTVPINSQSTYPIYDPPSQSTYPIYDPPSQSTYPIYDPPSQFSGYEFAPSAPSPLVHIV